MSQFFLPKTSSAHINKDELIPCEYSPIIPSKNDHKICLRQTDLHEQKQIKDQTTKSRKETCIFGRLCL